VNNIPLPQEEIVAGMSSEAALVLLLGGCVGAIDQTLALFLESDTPEGPHRSRVALRRLTTVLDGFQPLFRRKAWQRIRSRAKSIFRQLGKVRDAQVFLANLDDPARREKLARSADLLRDKVRRDLRHRRAVSFAPSLLRDLAEGKVLRRKAPGLALRQMPVDHLAAQSMDAVHAACLALGRDLATLSIEDLHEFRKRMKSLRYLSEFFAPLWQQPDWPMQRRALKEIQDALGTLNDQANARARGATVDPQKAEKAMQAAQREWDILVDAPAWWRGLQVS
jgi:CHAD domain-containing protein